MSFFGSRCCGKGVEGENEERPPADRRAPAKMRRKDFFRNKCRFGGPKVAVREWEEFSPSKLAPNRSLVTNQSDNWLRFGALKEKIEDFYSVASILMPCSEVESGYGINFDVTKENFPWSLYFSPSHDLPLEGDFKILFGSTHKNGPANSLLSEGLRKKFSEGLIFPLSRDLPLEGEKFPGNTRKNGASHS